MLTEPVRVTAAAPDANPVSASGSTVEVGDAAISTGVPVSIGSGRGACSSSLHADMHSANATTTAAALRRSMVPPTSCLRALTVPPVSIAAMLDRGLVEEVLTAARRRGGAFAEVFAEE